MKLLVTDNLISDLNQLDKFNISLEKVSIKEIPKQTQSLFENDKFKFVFDEFITLTSFNKLNINLDDNYIFQIKKSNLSKFISLGSSVDILYLDIQKKVNFFPWDLTNILYSSRKSMDFKLLDSFTQSERDFRNFLSYFTKELVRLKMLIEIKPKEVAEILNEKMIINIKMLPKRLKVLIKIRLIKQLNILIKLKKTLINLDTKLKMLRGILFL